MLWVRLRLTSWSAPSRSRSSRTTPRVATLRRGGCRHRIPDRFCLRQKGRRRNPAKRRRRWRRLRHGPTAATAAQNHGRRRPTARSRTSAALGAATRRGAVLDGAPHESSANWPFDGSCSNLPPARCTPAIGSRASRWCAHPFSPSPAQLGPRVPSAFCAELSPFAADALLWETGDDPLGVDHGGGGYS